MVVSTVQAVQTGTHLMSLAGSGEADTGVSEHLSDQNTDTTIEKVMVVNQRGIQGRLMSRVNSKRVQCHKVTWSKECWTGGIEVSRRGQRSCRRRWSC